MFTTDVLPAVEAPEQAAPDGPTTDEPATRGPPEEWPPELKERFHVLRRVSGKSDSELAAQIMAEFDQKGAGDGGRKKHWWN